MQPKLSYLIAMAFKHRRRLHNIKHHPQGMLQRVTDLTPDYLHQHHVKLLALDFDGVLSHHGSISPAPAVLDWLRTLGAAFPLDQICIYSNNVFDERVAYMKSQFPEIDFIFYQKKKPCPDDLVSYFQSKKLQAKDVLVVDDRLTSGVLAACIIGASSLLLQKPIIHYQSAFFQELYFRLIRFIERVLI